MRYLAIDFDDTIMDYETQEPIPGARESLETFKVQGDMITVFTNRQDQKYTWIRDWLLKNAIPFDRIVCGKPYYDLFIDDKAQKFEGWGIVEVKIGDSPKKPKISKDQAENMLKKYQNKSAV